MKIASWGYVAVFLALTSACKTPTEGSPARSGSQESAPQPEADRPAPRVLIVELVNVLEERREQLQGLVESALAQCRVGVPPGAEWTLTLGFTGEASIHGLAEDAARCLAADLGARITALERQEIYLRANGSKVGTILLKTP